MAPGFRSLHLSGCGNICYLKNFPSPNVQPWFQKPTFEWVWKLFQVTTVWGNQKFRKPAFERAWKLFCMFVIRTFSDGFRSPYLSGYGNLHFVLLRCCRNRFQKPAFEWVWKRFHCCYGVWLLLFQKPAFEWVWKLRDSSISHAVCVSEARIWVGMETLRSRSWATRLRFQKPAFEWVWKLLRASRLFSSEWFQKPAFERVWKHLLFKEFSISECPALVSEAHIWVGMETFPSYHCLRQSEVSEACIWAGMETLLYVRYKNF